MTALYYRLSNNEDPEERLEDAALWKALHDEYGDEITLLSQEDDIPKDGIFWGRTRRGEMHSSSGERHDYWNNPAFLNNCAREFHLATLEEAESLVADLHSRGKGAFVKATQRKYYTGAVPVGSDFNEVLGAMVYSFCDHGKCLMVQELCEFRYEQRYLFIGGQFATGSPIAWHVTPLDTETLNGEQFSTPRSSTPEPAYDKFLGFFADEVFRASGMQTVCIDVAWINGRPGVVEFNDLHIGQMGLYACDVRKIAKATRRLFQAREAA